MLEPAWTVRERRLRLYYFQAARVPLLLWLRMWLRNPYF